MSDDKSSSGGGIGFFGLLGIVFITLKLTGFIDWSWWYVTAPLWGPFILFIAVFMIVFIVAGITEPRSVRVVRDDAKSKIRKEVSNDSR